MGIIGRTDAIQTGPKISAAAGVDTSPVRRYFPRPSPDSSDENVFR
jgi:hypothetical protein